jgi:hypothetical protein
VPVGLVELRDRGADAHRLRGPGGLLHRLGHLLRVVLEEAHVEDVLEGPDPGAVEE